MALKEITISVVNNGILVSLCGDEGNEKYVFGGPVPALGFVAEVMGLRATEEAPEKKEEE